VKQLHHHSTSEWIRRDTCRLSEPPQTGGREANVNTDVVIEIHLRLCRRIIDTRFVADERKVTSIQPNVKRKKAVMRANRFERLQSILFLVHPETLRDEAFEAQNSPLERNYCAVSTKGATYNWLPPRN
jgi:hypothetical protein